MGGAQGEGYWKYTSGYLAILVIMFSFNFEENNYFSKIQISILTIFGTKWKQDTTCLKDWKNLCESVILLDISSFVSCLEKILFG